MSRRGQSLWVIYATLAVAVACHLLPLPFEWRAYRPPLVELTLLYWVLALPHRVGIVSSAIIGLVLDVLEGNPAGAQSLGLVLASLVLLLNYQRIRQFDVLQQSLTVMLLVALAKLIEHWSQGLVGLSGPTGGNWLAVLFAPLLWPLLRALLRSVRRDWRVT